MNFLKAYHLLWNSLFSLRMSCSDLFVGDGSEFRDIVIASNAIPRLVALVSSAIPVSVFKGEDLAR